MASSLRIQCLAACLVLLATQAQSQTILSPSQADLLTLQFADFIDNTDPGDVFDTASLDAIVADGDDVTVTFTTGYDINDDLYRVAMEVPAASWTGDLTGLDAFSISFRNPVIAPVGTAVTSIGAQIYVRHGANIFGTDPLFTSSGATAVSDNGLTTVSIPTSAIAAAQMTNFGVTDLTDITSFGIELFGGGTFDEFNPDLVMSMLNITTSPEPPTLQDTVLYSWENGADLQGWDSTPIVAGAHSHMVLEGAGSPAVGATNGNNSLKLTRHPSGNFFEWGTAITYDAFAGGGGGTLPADFNVDNTVDILDLDILSGNFGTTGTATPGTGDANADTNVDILDLDILSGSFGEVGGGADPVVQAQIDEIVDLINDPNAYSIAFDVTIEPQAPNPDPEYLVLHMAIASDGGPDNAGDPFFQNDTGNVSTLIGAGTPSTVEFLLSDFNDVQPASDTNGMSLAEVGLLDGTGFLTFHIATNMNLLSADVEIIIDNFRVRTIVPDPSAAVPEPATALVAVLAAGFMATRRSV